MLSENLISASMKYIILSVFGVLIVCILIACFAGSHRWKILLSFSTLLVAIVALLLAVFQDDIQTLRHKPDIAIYVGENLAEFEHGKWWIRGTVTNDGERVAKRCRIKLLTIEGANYATERPNAYLKWQGGIPDFMTLYPGEHWIFDIGSRDVAVKTPPFVIDAYVGNNAVTRQLIPRQLPYRETSAAAESSTDFFLANRLTFFQNST